MIRTRICSTSLAAMFLSAALTGAAAAVPPVATISVSATQDDWLASVQPDADRYVKAGMWQLGRNLVLYAMAGANQPESAPRFRKKTASLCRLVDFELPPLRDEKGTRISVGDDATRSARACNYILVVAGKPLGEAVARKHGAAGVAAFELGWRSYLAASMVGDADVRDMYARTIRTAGDASQLPDPTWRPVADFLASSRPASGYMDQLLRTERAMTAYMDALFPDPSRPVAQPAARPAAPPAAKRVVPNDDWIDDVQPNMFMYLRVGCWQIGRQVAVYALAAANDPELAERMRGKTETLCDIVDVKLPPLRDINGSPVSSGERPLRMAKALNYALDVAGKPLARAIDEKYGKKGLAAFELGLKSHLMSPMVADDDIRASLVVAMERAGEKAELPDPTWRPVTEFLASTRDTSDYVEVLFAADRVMEAYMQALFDR